MSKSHSGPAFVVSMLAALMGTKCALADVTVKQGMVYAAGPANMDAQGPGAVLADGTRVVAGLDGADLLKTDGTLCRLAPGEVATLPDQLICGASLPQAGALAFSQIHGAMTALIIMQVNALTVASSPPPGP